MEQKIKDTLKYMRIWKKLDEPDFYSTKKRKFVKINTRYQIRAKYEFKKKYIELTYMVSNSSTKGLQFYYSPSSTMYDVTLNDLKAIAFNNSFRFSLAFPEVLSFQDCLHIIEFCNIQQYKIIPLERCLLSTMYFEFSIEIRESMHFFKTKHFNPNNGSR